MGTVRVQMVNKIKKQKKVMEKRKMRSRRKEKRKRAPNRTPRAMKVSHTFGCYTNLQDGQEFYKFLSWLG